MTAPWTVYGQSGSGSVAIEAALTLLQLPFRLVETSLRRSEARDAFRTVNPMRQLPVLVLPSGELMTESAAILIWLAETHPEARLAPAPATPKRAEFLQWMAFVSAAIYALYWVRDDPSRLVDDKANQALVKDRTKHRISECWAVMDARLSPGRFLLGDDMSVLDLYVAVVSRWGLRCEGFYAAAPRMADCIRRVDDDDRLRALWALRMPPGDDE